MYYVVCTLIEEKLDVPNPIVTEFAFKMAPALEDKIRACAMAVAAMKVLGYKDDQFTFTVFRSEEI